MRVCKHGCDVSDLRVFLRIVSGIEHFSVFKEPRKVGRILESYANLRLRLGFA